LAVSAGKLCAKFVNEREALGANTTCTLAVPEWATAVVSTVLLAEPPTRHAGGSGSSKPPFANTLAPTAGVSPMTSEMSSR
jgi:hypothetical protein